MNEVRAKWRTSEAGARYAGARWSSVARRERDPRLVAALLARHLAPGPALLLDAPCGTGRLAPVLAAHGRTVGLDVSPAMLAEARRAERSGTAWLAGDVLHLPFRDGSFDAVVCCRLLHHLEPSALEQALRELVRVSRGLVIASFWDAGSLPALRRAWLGARPRETRRAVSRAVLSELLERCGAEVVGWKHSLRFLSRQAFVAARRRRP
ncbi:MAG TPA: class I SAM-dependent methyltransferase [Planctomycetota bacterium]